MEAWRYVWREGVAPQLSLAGLEALRVALLADDPRLLQGAITTPPPLQHVREWPCEGACLVGLPAWLGDGLATLAEVHATFAETCHKADMAIGEIAACRWLLEWYDETPRKKMRQLLLPEVERTIAQRTEKQEA